ncbi:MAG TPA: AbrB/MazE/SpoVT family DNA-binding domain-containing protein [Nitrosopumilaceae archaeon]|nr:AbrB/MazE/SpoVT family DNA-binding domain-containing protein [Nitrosopumilaceae archaeon]
MLEIVLQKQRSRNYKDTNYKYRITIPTQIVEQLELEGRKKLKIFVVEDAIVIRKIPNT